MNNNLAFFIPDIHFGMHDEKCINAGKEAIKELKPKWIFELGDIVDFYNLARFLKDPEQPYTIQQEVDMAVDFYDWLRVNNPNSTIYKVPGNHEARLRKALWGNSPAIASLRCLGIKELFQLGKFNIKYCPEGVMKFYNLIVKHGSSVRPKSGYTAHREIAKAMSSGVSGHTHRLAHVYYDSESGGLEWVESGCWCKKTAGYLDGEAPDWQQGFSWGVANSGHDKKFRLNIKKIEKGKIIGGL